MLPLNPDDQARFFYLAILGMAVASGLFYRYRGRLSTALQHAAIWVLIFLGMTLAYGFREPLLAVLNPDMARQVGGGTVELRRADDGHFYASLKVDGTNIRFMVDTGASNIVLTREDARRLGIDLNGLSYVLPADTANGRVYGAGIVLDRVEFGGVTDRNVRAMVNGGPMDTSLLGMDYLKRFRSLHVEGDRMYLER